MAGTIDFGPSSEPALKLMDAVADGRIDGPLTAWHCCLELYSVTTRLPEEYRLSPEVALRVLEEEILPRFEIHDLPDTARDTFFSAAVAEGAVGGRIYDVHIAEIAFDLYRVAEEMKRQNLRRQNPDATEEEIEQGVREWLRHRPGAEHGDGVGRPRPKPLEL